MTVERSIATKLPVCILMILCSSQYHQYIIPTTNAFVIRTPAIQHRNEGIHRPTSRIICHNFFKNLLDSAFDNDPALIKNSDKRIGMLEGPNDDPNDEESIFLQAPSTRQQEQARRLQELTDTQKAWRERQKKQQEITDDDIITLQSIILDLYLSGVPNKDPSNDLYGTRVNISSRDRTVGLALPTQPTIRGFVLELLPNNKCRIVDDDNSGFGITGDDTKDEYSLGDWKLSDDKTQIRFRFGVNGYQRTIETKGTIQKVYWSAQDETTTQTSTVYTIPRGWLYGECKVSKIISSSSTQPQIQWDPDTSILKIEQSTGFMGISSKMIACGKFKASSASSSSSVPK